VSVLFEPDKREGGEQRKKGWSVAGSENEKGEHVVCESGDSWMGSEEIPI
jgi:hypothetical protein